MFKVQILLILAVGFIFINLSAAEELQIAGGKIKGKLGKSEAGVEVREFLGIKYGNAKRFEKAVPYSSWSGVQDATKFREVCHQFGLIASLQPQITNQSDDCLYLNVWAPAAKNNSSKKPVMVFIHGGAFEGGSGVMEGADIAALGDVILVTINYRLGPLGWMIGGDLQTNQGLHDQLLALKWVSENIKFFGGDSSQVTIFGESAGSMSVSAHIFSTLSKGLFKRAIMQSGSLAVDILCNSKERALEKTAILGAKVNCNQTDTGKLVDCIKKVDVEKLKAASMDDFVSNAFFVPVWGDEFLPLKPQKALESGSFNKDVDLIYGTNRDEGSIFAIFIVPDIMGNDHLNKEALKEYMKRILTKYNIGHSQEIIDYYSGKVTANYTQDDFKSLVSDAFGDYALVCPTVLFGEEMARKSSPNSRFYAYRLMEYKPAMGPKWMGVAHSADLQYLFSLASTKGDADLYQLGKDMIHAWTSFAKTGSPGKLGSAEWTEAVGGNKAVKDYRTKYMHLETKQFKMVDRFFEATCDSFWKPKMFS